MSITVNQLMKRKKSINDFLPKNIRYGVNKLMFANVNSKTKLIIVGTFLSDIPFFYVGVNNYLYNWIDLVKNTNLKLTKNEIRKNSATRQGNIQKLISELNELGVAIFDVIKDANVIDFNSGEDENIESFVLDDEMLGLLKEATKNKSDLNIISVTRFAEAVLNESGIKNRYEGLVCKGVRRETWTQLIDECLK